MYDRKIDTFIAVADCGSFLKAAEKLSVTAVSVMKQINSFESQIGVNLFIRTNHGTKLTETGIEIYKTAKQIIEISENALQKVRQQTKNGEIIIKIGTSLLYPCKALIDLWSKVSNATIKIHIIPLGSSQTDLLSIIEKLDKEIDCFVAPYDSNQLKELCYVHPLGRYNFCISVPNTHKLVHKKELVWSDLFGESLMLLKKGYSPTVDQIRETIEKKYPQIRIIDSQGFYNAEIFNECAQKGYLIETIELWTDIHPSLTSIPMNWDYGINYGIVYPKKANHAVMSFIKAISKI